MKLLHIGDLHLGIKFHKRSLLEDQYDALRQVINIANEEEAHVIIAGDVFDTVNPSIEAQECWFWFLGALSQLHSVKGLHTFVIAGNHDSAARLGLPRAFTSSQGIHIVNPHTWASCVPMSPFSSMHLLLVPFVKPSTVESVTGESDLTYDEAFKTVVNRFLEDEDVDAREVILVAHQSFEGCKLGESEFRPFMSDAISLDTVADFPLVLAGHIHAYQRLNNVSYCGSLLPYAFGDDYNAGISIWEQHSDASWTHRRVPLHIKHKLVTLNGDLAHCLAQDAPDDYVKVNLVNCAHFDEALHKLEEHFPLLCTVTTDAVDDWEADLTKEVVAFENFEEALNAFCDHLEVPRFKGRRAEIIQEALDAYQNSENS